jgi:superoxide dismutase, Cu-Zn family
MNHQGSLATALLPLFAVGLLSAGVAAVAQAPKSAHADIANAQGTTIGHATFTTAKDGVRVKVTVSQLAAGEHGIHIHNAGKCEGPAFASAGGHFNPTSTHHGIHNAQEPHPHIGDLPNLTVNDKGTGKLNFLIPGATLGEGTNSLLHDGGTALVIHAKPDDLASDPSGNSGDRVACGVILK